MVAPWFSSQKLTLYKSLTNLLTSVKVLYNLWTCIAREAFPEFQSCCGTGWFIADVACDVIYVVDIAVNLRETKVKVQGQIKTIVLKILGQRSR